MSFDVAAKLLAQPDSALEVLQIHQFQSDEEYHNDILQDTLVRDFEHQFEALVEKLRVNYGDPVWLDGDVTAIPLCGVYRNAMWRINGRKLFLAAAHEDRECPFLLVLCTAS
jgi:hypothetical protein